MPRGGYREPSNPAPVSGPGALSKRTDGVPKGEVKGLAYGENQSVNALAGQGPMAPPRTGPDPIPLSAPTNRPDEPITAGAPFGPGPGPAPNMAVDRRLSSTLRMMIGDDITGEISDLLLQAERMGL